MANNNKVGDRQGGEGHHDSTKMADTVMVPSVDEKGIDGSACHTKSKPSLTGHGEDSSIVTETGSACRTLPLAGPKQDKLTPSAVSLIALCTRSSTKAKYSSIANKWIQYCQKNGYPLMATTNRYANFLASEFNRNLKYSYVRSC